MRIVFLTHNYPRHAGDVSGAFLATLVHALVARGHDLRVIAPSDGGETGEPMLDGIPVAPWPRRRGHRWARGERGGWCARSAPRPSAPWRMSGGLVPASRGPAIEL